LGNFAFYAGSPEGARTGVLVLTVAPGRVEGYQWVPAQIQGRVPTPLAGEAAADAVAQWDALRGCTDLTG
jgi:hypothetical protein